jgi:hypothetical protein
VSSSELLTLERRNDFSSSLSLSFSLCLYIDQINSDKLTVYEKVNDGEAGKRNKEGMTKKRKSYVANVWTRDQSRVKERSIFTSLFPILPSVPLRPSGQRPILLPCTFVFSYHPPSYSLRHALSRSNPRTTLNDATS